MAFTLPNYLACTKPYATQSAAARLPIFGTWAGAGCLAYGFVQAR